MKPVRWKRSVGQAMSVPMLVGSNSRLLCKLQYTVNGSGAEPHRLMSDISAAALCIRTWYHTHTLHRTSSVPPPKGPMATAALTWLG
eukprot:1159669-Pelagomonas_calceolata.AAC.1